MIVVNRVVVDLLKFTELMVTVNPVVTVLSISVHVKLVKTKLFVVVCRIQLVV